MTDPKPTGGPGDDGHGGGRAVSTREAVPRAGTAPARAGAAAKPANAASAAFDALYVRNVRGLLRQVELLTGNPPLARHTVKRAFDLAWQRWPEVAVDPDPAGWVRAAAYEYALAPWRRWMPGRHARRSAPAGLCAGLDRDRALRAALLRLPPSYRRAVLLYDGLGLDLPETAAETEASTPTTANRITQARAALASDAPALDTRTPGRIAALLGGDPAGALRRPSSRPTGYAARANAGRGV